jgi:hypothetical protein
LVVGDLVVIDVEPVENGLVEQLALLVVAAAVELLSVSRSPLETKHCQGGGKVFNKKKRERKRLLRSSSIRRKSQASSKSTHFGMSTAWISGIAASVVTTILATLALWIGPELIDSPFAKDRIRTAVRPEPPIRYTVEFLDDAFMMVLPSDVKVTPLQRRYLDNWSIENEDPTHTGYTLNRLLTELRNGGGANPSYLDLKITLEGRRNQPIHIDRIYPVELRRSSPLQGTLLNIPPEAPGKTIKIMFDMESYWKLWLPRP